MTTPITFVVSTGRAGSTLLSRMLRLHPQVLSVSEFFAVLQGILRRYPYPDAALDGRQLWRLVSAPDPLADAMVRNGMVVPEMFYPYDTGRFKAETGIPIICHSTLSLLSEDPDALLDALERVVPGWPVRPAADQYREFLGLLAAMLGRPVIVERSGGSVVLVGLLRQQFPEARFVLMYRDGPDTALSMSLFPMFKLGVLTARAAERAGLRANATMAEIQANLPAEYRGVLSPPYDLSGLAEVEMAPLRFAALWSDMMCLATSELAGCPPEGLAVLCYEDLVGASAPVLARLAAFLGVPAARDWLDACAKLIDPARAGAAARLDPALRAELAEACAPGTMAIREFTARWH